MRFIRKWDILAENNHLDFPSEIAITSLRVFAGLSMALAHGAKKIPIPEKFLDYLSETGFPFPYVVAWLAALFEFLGGILLALGLYTRLAAFFIFIVMATAALYAHRHDPFSKAELAHIYGFVALLFIAFGGTRFSIDRLLRKKS
ncbi:MAG: DoxX family protein [Leptospiraceae bacterium]|nr:DoxX family protein [Leptospiraceae bacterium]MDW8307618.1 DoxX family protein [Leptospiraceae bacterium]